MLYTASLFFRSLHRYGDNGESLWEESIILLQAGDEAQALEKAGYFGQQAEVAYANRERDVVSWRFISVERVCAVEANLHVQPEASLETGIEIFSRFLSQSEAQSMLGD